MLSRIPDGEKTPGSFSSQCRQSVLKQSIPSKVNGILWRVLRALNIISFTRTGGISEPFRALSERSVKSGWHLLERTFSGVSSKRPYQWESAKELYRSHENTALIQLEYRWGTLTRKVVLWAFPNNLIKCIRILEKKTCNSTQNGSHSICDASAGLKCVFECNCATFPLFFC